MKTRTLLFFFLLINFLAGQAQTTNKIQADSVRIYQIGSNAELIIENATRNRIGAFLRNRGNGRTEFAYALDTVWMVENSLHFRHGQKILSFNINVGSSDSLTYATNYRLYRALDSALAVVKPYAPTITTFSAATTITSDWEIWGYTGTAPATATLPATGVRHTIYNRSDYTLTVTGNLFTNQAAPQIKILKGDSYNFIWDGTYWKVF